jgi:hypothetical protein
MCTRLCDLGGMVCETVYNGSYMPLGQLIPGGACAVAKCGRRSCGQPIGKQWHHHQNDVPPTGLAIQHFLQVESSKNPPL